MEELVDHLVSQGHRRIAFINHGTGPIAAGFRDVSWPKGYLHAMTRHQLVLVPGWNEFMEMEAAVDRLLTNQVLLY